MAPTAYVLIDTEAGKEREILENLKKTNGVKKAAIVYGKYDIIATIHEETVKGLEDTIAQMKETYKIKSTSLCSVLERDDDIMGFSRNNKGDIEPFKP